MSAETLKHATAWVTQLAAITRHTEPLGKDTIASYAVVLDAEFPPVAFTTQSLHAVSHDCEFMPAHAVLRRKLAEWWESHKPQQRVISGPGDPNALNDTEAAWLRRYWTQSAKGFCECGTDGCTKSRGHMISLLKAYAPKAYRKVVGVRAA